jgi:hypothetical protein
MSDNYDLARLKGAFLAYRKSEGSDPSDRGFFDAPRLVSKRGWTNSDVQSDSEPTFGSVIVVSGATEGDARVRFKPTVRSADHYLIALLAGLAWSSMATSWFREVRTDDVRKLPYGLKRWLAHEALIERKMLLAHEALIERKMPEAITRIEPAKLPVPQPPSDFIPSATLVEYWRQGLNAHRANARRISRSSQSDRFLESQTKEELARAFSLRLRRMLSVIGNRQRYGIEDYKHIGAGERFSLEVQYQVLDRIQILPDEATEFFSLLYAELSQYLSYGGKLGGSWGELVLRDGSLELMTKPEASVEEPWEPAEVLE